MSGKIVVTEFISVDGVIEDPGGSEDFEHGGWTVPFWHDNIGAAFVEMMKDEPYATLGGSGMPGGVAVPAGVAVDSRRRQVAEPVVRERAEMRFLAVLVVFLFLRDWRATLISAIAIPLSAIPTGTIVHNVELRPGQGAREGRDRCRPARRATAGSIAHTP